MLLFGNILSTYLLEEGNRHNYSDKDLNKSATVKSYEFNKYSSLTNIQDENRSYILIVKYKSFNPMLYIRTSSELLLK